MAKDITSNERQDVSLTHAVDTIKTAILQSQLRAVKAVNQEQLALYYGIGRYISANTRNKNWGSGMIKAISQHLRNELPGLRGFGESNLKNMRAFYEAWNAIEQSSPVATDNYSSNSAVTTDELTESTDTEDDTIRQLQLTNLVNFPIVAFLSISFTHHSVILTKTKEWDERLFYIQFAADNKVTAENLEGIIKKDLFHHQGKMPNNFLRTILTTSRRIVPYRCLRMITYLTSST